MCHGVSRTPALYPIDELARLLAVGFCSAQSFQCSLTAPTQRFGYCQIAERPRGIRIGFARQLSNSRQWQPAEPTQARQERRVQPNGKTVCARSYYRRANLELGKPCGRPAEIRR